MRTGGVEPPQPEALALQAGELADAQRPREGVAGRTRTGAAGITTPNAHRYTTATIWTGTAGLEPAASRLTSERSGRLSYAPDWSRAGGIRTHGLELMRLARTTAPLPRKVWLAGLEPAIPGFRGRWGGQFPHSQMTTVAAHVDMDSTLTLVGDPGLLPRLLPLGTGVVPLPRGRPGRR
jgi:hypothetical protein